MSETLEIQDDNLRDRIRDGYETNTKCKSAKIENRQKTPKNSAKETKAVRIHKNVTYACEKHEKTPKKKYVEKCDITESMDGLDINTKKASPRKSIAEKTAVNAVYLCQKCDKEYKSKNGIRKHMALCAK